VVAERFNIFYNRLNNVKLNTPLYNYFHSIIEKVEKEYIIAKKARSKKIDPDTKPESIFTWDMAERIEYLISLKGIAEYIRKYSSYTREELAFKLIDMLLRGVFGNYSRDQLAEIAVRLSVAVLTEGMTVAPVEGIRKVIIKRGKYGEYLSIYYAGPIRSAGGTEAGLSIIYADYIRKQLGLSKYIPSEQEVYRYLEELRLYERYVGSFQYKHSDEDFLYAVRRLPVEVTGVPTEEIEVVVHRDLPGVETNRVRGGAIRVINDGLIGKASKILSVTRRLKLDDWNWLEHYRNKVEVNNKEPGSISSSDKILRDIVIGRPVFSLSDESSSFRVRYGRMDNSGISAAGIHPSVFPLLDYFIVIGSQLKVNFPGKAAIVVPCDICDPPIVELEDRSVIELKSPEQAEALRDKIKKILWLGDILISYGDFLENNHFLVPSPYVSEWWMQDLKNVLNMNPDVDVTLERLISKVVEGYIPSYKEAKLISKKFGIPMHPYYTPRWNRISMHELKELINLIVNGRLVGNNFITSYNERLIFLFKKLLITYRIRNSDIVVSERYSPLIKDLSENYFLLNFLKDKNMDVFSLLNNLLGVEFRDTEGYKISARLGRPEKVKPRQLSPPVHVLFPIEDYGGPQRDIIKAMKERDEVTIRLGIRYCPKCKNYTYKRFCEICGRQTEKRYYCPYCKTIVSSEICPKCGRPTQSNKRWTISLKDLIISEIKTHKLFLPKKVKGVKGLLNREGIPEDISKGLIRAKHGITIFKDGTARVDITNAPLHRFRPRDIDLPIEKAKKLGYVVSSETEVIDLYPNDIIIPKSAADYLLRVSQYIDELLVKVYELPPYYNFKSRIDLIGTIIIGLSPHTSVGVLGRIIGFTDSQVLYANPLWHAAKRRDCDGDQDSIMLLLDALLNFSRYYLPKSSGGEMDAPIFISIFMHPEEVDTQVHNMDVTRFYPRDFYLETLNKADPKSVRKLIICIEDLLGSPLSFYKFSSFGYPSILSLKKNVNTYSSIKSMEGKLEQQLKLIDKIFDEKVKKRIILHLIDHHIVRDISGNIKSFATQTFRCKKCNHIHRRLPLDGKCEVCGGELIQTVSIKSVVKYLPYAKKLSELIDDPYLKSVVSILEADINSTFKTKKIAITSLTDLFAEESEQDENQE